MTAYVLALLSLSAAVASVAWFLLALLLWLLEGRCS